MPVSFGLQAACGGGRTWIRVVDKHHAVSDEDVVFDDYTFTDERVARDLAPFAYRCVLLDLDKGSDLCFVANLASIKVDELGKLDVSSKLYVRRDAYVSVHKN
jgi:hypothetical protein